MLEPKRYLLVFIIMLSAGAAAAQDYTVTNPPPDEWATYQFRNETGKLKRDKAGFLDPSPDVISLKYLPRDRYGFVDWMKALNTNVIKPRDYIGADAPPVAEADSAEYDKDVLIRAKLDFMPDVIFPHSAHNAWLKCSICHPRIFRMQAGATPISMIGIWKGDFCGRCHDRVAFPIRNCFRCHSAPRNKKNGGTSAPTNPKAP